MNAYLAKLVYRIICGNGDHTPQFDEQLRLIYACNETDAINKACETGRKEEHSFVNNNHNLVAWKFIDISELISIEEYADGAEVFSIIKEPIDAELYIQYVHQKSKTLSTAACKFANT